MRRLVVFLCLLALALAAGGAAATGSPNDGSLSLRNVVGDVTLDVRGAVIGRFDRGTMTVSDPVEGDGAGPLVRGAERTKTINAVTTAYAGTYVRFRLIGGRYIVRIRSASDLDLSAVGKGTVVLTGDLLWDNGEYAFNGDDYQPMPWDRTRFVLTATTEE
jgi:hypothetical protein